MKKCCKCKEEKELEAFSKNRSTKSGLSPDCRACRSADQKQRHINYMIKVNAGKVEKKPVKKKERVFVKPKGQTGLSKYSSHSYIGDANKAYSGMESILDNMFPKDKGKKFKYSQI
jgi:hypothetical protein